MNGVEAGYRSIRSRYLGKADDNPEETCMKTRNVLSLLCAIFLLFAVSGCALSGSDGKGTETGNETGLEGLDQYGFTWRRTGGIAGFCDIVSISGGGKAIVQSCASDPPQTIGEVELTPAMTRQLTGWIDKFGPFNYRESDPAVADAMLVVIEFSGQGTESPTTTDYSAMQKMVQEVMRLLSESQ